MILPFRTVAQGKNELKPDEAQIEILEDSVNDRSRCVAKRKGSATIRSARCTDKIHDDTGRQPESSCAEESAEFIAAETI